MPKVPEHSHFPEYLAREGGIRRGRIAELVDQYLRHRENAGAAAVQDARFRLELELMRRLLEIVDEAMQAEGVPADARDRVLTTAVYGTPDPDTATRRIAAQRAAVERLKLSGPIGTLSPELRATLTEHLRRKLTEHLRRDGEQP